MEVYVDVVGNAQLLGIENGDITDLTAYNSSFRKTFGGRLLAYVRTTPDAEFDIKLNIGSPLKKKAKRKAHGSL